MEQTMKPYRMPPRCAIHQTIMCEQFTEQRINDHLSMAIPTGTYICYQCRHQEEAHDGIC